MKTRSAFFLSSLAVLALAGCDTVPTVQYPITYQVPIGNSTVTSAYGPQNLNVSGQQTVPAIPGQPLYFQIVSPVDLTLYAFDQTGPGPGGPVLNHSVGSYFNSPVIPTGSNVEFVFSAAQQGTGGTVQFTVSDHPIASAPPMTSAVPPAPGPNAVSMTPTQ
jgi:hypothetical protein